MDPRYSYFLKADVEGHLGEWIAIVGNKIVAHSKSAKTTYAKAKQECPKEEPLLCKVPTEQAMIL